MDPGPVSGIGPKAESLRLLIEAGLPVPEARFLDADAFREHLGRTGLADVLRRAGDAGPDHRAARSAIEGVEVDARVARRLRGWHHELGGGALAVRSSGTAEDLPHASFAGQHGTYFVADADGLVDRVRDCWASLYSERATAYRKRNGIAHDAVSMAVIVQRLVPAVAAGVVFTVDPVSGADDVVVEACAGLGEALVSGKVVPDRFVFARDGLAAREIVAGRKPVRVTTSAGPGADAVVEEALDEKDATALSVDEATALEVARLALRAEGLFGAPVDVEWAFDGQTVWLLQARPITARAPSPAGAVADAAPAPSPAAGSPVVWSNVNTGEILPDVASPMTWSVIHGHAQEIFGGAFGALGVRLDARSSIGLVGGRIYFNLNALRAAVAHLPGLDVTTMLGGMQGFVELPPVPEEHTLGRRAIARAMLGFPVWLYRHTARKAARFTEVLRLENDESYARLCAPMSADEAWSRTEHLMGGFSRFNESLAFMFEAMFGFAALGAVTKRWLDDESGALANLLVAGSGDVVSAESGRALWDLAVLARADDYVLGAVTSAAEWPQVRSELEHRASDGVDEAATFLAAWDAFMVAFGHHRRGELEFANASWAERPDYILGIVRGYLAHDEGVDPTRAFARRAEEAHLVADECLAGLRGPVRRAVFRRALAWGRSSARARENIKSEAIRWLVAIRLTMLVLADRLVERGVLGARDDVFFLTYEELASVMQGESRDVRPLVATRRAEHERLARLSPPPVVIGVWDEASAGWDVPTDVRTLEGMSVSAGVARGPARVFLSVDDDEAVLPGEILVAPFTDPGWTPYFIPAAGIVMDMGGLLSHGSIIAREYGIPAVVNVGPATRIIETGQLIEVDGDAGVVRILS